MKTGLVLFLVTMFGVVLSLLIVVAAAKEANLTMKEESKSSKLQRQFSILQVVKFPNTSCPGTGSRNGTCYTQEECSFRKGVASGSCANGFGVCCVFTLSCGQTTSENCSFLTLADPGNVPTNCAFTICECNPNICRIRLDFLTFSIAGPVVGTTVGGGVAPALSVGGGIGDCVTDSFVLSSPGGKGSPVICGSNTGQHMYVDTTQGSCATAAFNFAATSAIRNFDIKVTQYSCQDEMGGPLDCLQYFTGNEGTIKSFNFGFSASPVVKSATHLSNQCYSVCIRRRSGKCIICFSPSIIPIPSTQDDQISFGLSNPVIVIAQAAVGTNCATDYLIIPNAAKLVSFNGAGVTRGIDRFCGRIFSVADGATRSDTICTAMRPFRIIFKSDANEATGTNIADKADTNEQGLSPGGIVGFSLNYFQVGC